MVPVTNVGPGHPGEPCNSRQPGIQRRHVRRQRRSNSSINQRLRFSYLGVPVAAGMGDWCDITPIRSRYP